MLYRRNPIIFCNIRIFFVCFDIISLKLSIKATKVSNISCYFCLMKLRSKYRNRYRNKYTDDRDDDHEFCQCKSFFISHRFSS